MWELPVYGRLMNDIVRIHVDGPREHVEEILRSVRGSAGAGSYPATVWCPPRWQEEAEVRIDDVFEIEVPAATNRASALDRVRQAVEAIDPERQVVKGGDIDLVALPL